ncbi:MAG: hypothetical protein H8E44_26440 [Planctomycetes bacterium]|nr:hypothetical protein [Planctomycetota bacterium]
MIGSLLLISCSVLGQADDANASDKLGLEVRRLAKQLDDDSLEKRQAAEKELIELGPDALKLLPPITRHTSAEVKLRLDRVRKALETSAAKAAAEASTVTLEGDMLLSEAFAALEKQTGNKIMDFRAQFRQERTDPTVTASFDKTTFWVALDRLLDQANLTVYNFSGREGVVAFVGRNERERDRADRGTYSGLFRFEGVAAYARRDLRNPQNDSLKLEIEVAWEPRLTPIVLQLDLPEQRAIADTGEVVAVDSRQSRLEIPVESSIAAAELPVPLMLPNRSVKKLTSLKGKLSALVPGRVETFEFENLEGAKAVEQQKAGVTVILDQVRKNVDLFEVRVRVRFDKAENALESHRGWIYNNEAYLLDPDGKKLDNDGYQAYRQDVNEIGVAYLFDREAGLKGCKLVYKTPVLIMKIPVEYELKDIDLP